MRIAVYGATGMIGREIVAEAVDRGHTVTAITRTGAPTELAAAVRAGSLTDTSDVATVAAEHDVVVNAAGGTRGDADAMAAWPTQTREFALATGDTRSVYVGGAGSLLTADGVRLVDTPEFNPLYKTEALAGAAALEELRALPESVNWTYVSPAPVIAPGERTGEYVVAIDNPAGSKISSPDYAVAILDEIEAPRHVRSRFTVAN